MAAFVECIEGSSGALVSIYVCMYIYIYMCVFICSGDQNSIYRHTCLHIRSPCLVISSLLE